MIKFTRLHIKGNKSVKLNMFFLLYMSVFMS